MTTGALFYSFLLLLCGRPALAQGKGPGKPSADPVFQISFSGGRLADYIRSVREKAPDANIVIDAVDSVKVPPARLEHVTLPLSLEWIQHTADARLHSLVFRTVRAGRDSGTVFLFTGPPRVDDRQVKAYAVTDDARDPAKPEQLRVALQATLQRQRHDTIPIAEYNADVGILTVAGRRSDIILADQMMDAVAQSRRAYAPALRRLQSQVDSLRARLKDRP